MRRNLLETYSAQLNVADKYLSRNFDGKRLSNQTALTTAVVLDNTNRFRTESLDFGMGSAAQRSDLGAWRKFCLNLTNIAVPSLIANDLVIVHPMTSYSGSVAYLEYVAGQDKGGVKTGDTLNSVFGLGEVGPARTNYTSETIVENVRTDGNFELAGAVQKGAISYLPDGVAHPDYNVGVKTADVKVIHKDGKVEYPEVTTTTAADGKEKYTVAGLKAGDRVVYKSAEFQRQSVPATKIPSLKPVRKHIPLVAQPRRIAVQYDQITAYQAKTDYGFSLDKQIAEQACGELAFEIDTEIVDRLYEGAKSNGTEIEWSKTLPVGVSKRDHYRGFLEAIDQAATKIYEVTKKYSPNYMVVARDVLQVLSFIDAYKAISKPKRNGPYKAGELNGLAVYVSPTLASGEWFVGLNGTDMRSSAGVYAPYRAIVPTQLLGTPDGGLAQGFSTWYAKALLNKGLLAAGKIVA